MALNPYKKSAPRVQRKGSMSFLKTFSEEWKRQANFMEKDDFLVKIFWVKEKDRQNDPERDDSIAGKGIIVHHNSFFRKLWDSITCVLLIILAITLPLTLAFEIESDFLNAMNWIQTVWFLTDVPLNFVTTFQSVDKILITDHKSIAIEYIQGWFWIDLASSLPINEMVDARASSASIAHGLKLMKLFKLLRLLRFDRIIYKIQQKNQIKFSTVAIMKFLLMLLTGAHWLGLLFYLVSVESGCKEPHCSWVLTWASDKHFYNPIDGRCQSCDYDCCREWTLLSRYIVCLYWAITTMSTIGFGDITPKSDFEILMALAAMLVGTVFFAHGLTNMCSILFYHNKFQVDTEAAMDELFDFFSRHHIPVHLGRKIQRFLWYKANTGHLDKSKERWLTEVSQQLSVHLGRKLLGNAFPATDRGARYVLFNLFGDTSDFFRYFAMKLKPICYLEDEVIIHRGDRIGAVYYIADGTVEYSDDAQQSSLSKFCSFGEQHSMVGRNDGSMMIRASSEVTLFRIDSNDFRQIIEKFDFFCKPYAKLLETRKRNYIPDFVDPLNFTEDVAAFLDHIGLETKKQHNLSKLFRLSNEENEAGKIGDRDDHKSVGFSSRLTSGCDDGREGKELILKNALRDQRLGHILEDSKQPTGGSSIGESKGGTVTIKHQQPKTTSSMASPTNISGSVDKGKDREGAELQGHTAIEMQSV